MEKESEMNTKKKGRAPYKILVFVLVVMSLYSYFAASASDKRVASKTVSSTRSEAKLSQEANPYSVMKDLIQTHPHQEIRNDLNDLIIRGEIGLTFQQLKSAPNTQANVVYAQDPKNGERVLVLNYAIQDLLDSSLSRLYKQLVIYHEWIHIKQQREKRYPEWLATIDRPVQYPADVVEILLKSEMEAYSAQCELAIKLDVFREFEFCRAYKTNGAEELSNVVLAGLSRSL
ncbi:hypothetical protein KJ937_02970 [Patescibacteria group bacterium]|nr:hypothetical protein [Patescibacteria group bacterium]